jgi:hypothetical protein
MGAGHGNWPSRHRNAIILGAASVLGVFLPLPGYLLAALYWAAGGHDINSPREGVVFVSFIVLVSAANSGFLAHVILPRRVESMRSESPRRGSSSLKLRL